MPQDPWDLWYCNTQPEARVGSETASLLRWNGTVGWYAVTYQCAYGEKEREREREREGEREGERESERERERE